MLVGNNHTTAPELGVFSSLLHPSRFETFLEELGSTKLIGSPERVVSTRALRLTIFGDVSEHFRTAGFTDEEITEIGGDFRKHILDGVASVEDHLVRLNSHKPTMSVGSGARLGLRVQPDELTSTLWYRAQDYLGALVDLSETPIQPFIDVAEVNRGTWQIGKMSRDAAHALPGALKLPTEISVTGIFTNMSK